MNNHKTTSGKIKKMLNFVMNKQMKNPICIKIIIPNIILQKFPINKVY